MSFLGVRKLSFFTGSDDEVNAYLDLLELQTRQTLIAVENWRAVEAVAEGLLESEQLTGKELRQVIEAAIHDPNLWAEVN
jgi:ATP-dependent Zn protease